MTEGLQAEADMNPPAEFANLFKLPIEERIQLAHDLWDSAEADQAASPLPTWQLDELRHRLARYEAGQTKTHTWEEVKKMIADEIAARP